MATRQEIARVVGHLKDLGAFRDYVKMLQEQRDDAIARLLAETDESKVPSLRGEARAYDTELKHIYLALKDQA